VEVFAGSEKGVPKASAGTRAARDVEPQASEATHSRTVIGPVTFEGRRCEYQYIGAKSGGALVEGAGTHDWPARGDRIEATVEGTRASRRCRSAALVGRVQVALRSEVAIRQLASAGCEETPHRDCRCSPPASPARPCASPRQAKVVTSEQTRDRFARRINSPS
jgi:hypothetical protein